MRSKITDLLQPSAEAATSPASGSVKPAAKRMIYSKVQNNYLLVNKKSMLVSMRRFYHMQDSCVFRTKVFPLTFLFNRKNYVH
jgi:hypothetical protein